MKTPNTTYDFYAAPNAPPATPDVAGKSGQLSEDFWGIRRPWTNVLEVPADTPFRDGWPTPPAHTVCVPDRFGQQYTVVFVERVRRSGGEVLRVYLQRLSVTRTVGGFSLLRVGGRTARVPKIVVRVGGGARSGVLVGCAGTLVPATLTLEFASADVPCLNQSVTITYDGSVPEWKSPAVDECGHGLNEWTLRCTGAAWEFFGATTICIDGSSRSPTATQTDPFRLTFAGLPVGLPCGVGTVDVTISE